MALSETFLTVGPPQCSCGLAPRKAWTRGFTLSVVKRALRQGRRRSAGTAWSEAAGETGARRDVAWASRQARTVHSQPR